MKNSTTDWSVEDSADLYGIGNWGADYFSVSRKGEVMVHPHGNGVGVSLRKIIDGLDDRGLDMPVGIDYFTLEVLNIGLGSGNDRFGVRGTVPSVV